MNIPSRKECMAILNKNKTPSNVIEHSIVVCKVAEEITQKLIKKGVKVNKEIVIAASLLHDIEREKKNHVVTGANLIRRLGFPEVADVAVEHSLYQSDTSDKIPRTIEQKIVFYADKRVKNDKIVSVKERYDDIKERYNVDLSWEMKFTKKIEEELNQ